MTEEEHENEKLKQTIIKNLFENGVIRRVTEALFIRCGLNLDTRIHDDVISETFLQVSKMPAAKLIEIAKSKNHLEAYVINISKNVGVLLSPPKREKSTIDIDGKVVKGAIIPDVNGLPIRAVSKQKMVEYLRFGSCYTSTDVINPFDEFEASYSEANQSTNIILVNEEDDNTFNLLFELIKAHCNEDEINFIEEMLQKKHKKKNVEKYRYEFIIEKLKLKVKDKMKDKEQEIKRKVIALMPRLYELVNKQRSQVTADIVSDVLDIQHGRMVLEQIPYNTLNGGCGDCVRDYIYSIISYYESPAFQPPVVDEDVKEIEYQEGFLKSIDAKLDNERFVANAKPEIIENEKKKKVAAEAKIKQLKTKAKKMSDKTTGREKK